MVLYESLNIYIDTNSLSFVRKYVVSQESQITGTNLRLTGDGCSDGVYGKRVRIRLKVRLKVL